jgi:thioredoxin reductase
MAESKFITDIVIIGDGAVGLMAALELGKADVSIYPGIV